jgi:hypothetical protein
MAPDEYTYLEVPPGDREGSSLAKRRIFTSHSTGTPSPLDNRAVDLILSETTSTCEHESGIIRSSFSATSFECSAASGGAISTFIVLISPKFLVRKPSQGYDLVACDLPTALG